VELIVALAVAGILIGVATGLLASGSNIISSAKMQEQDRLIAARALDFVSDELRYATTLGAVGSSVSPAAPGGVSEGMSMLYLSGDAGAAATDEGMLFYRRAGDAGAGVNIMGKSAYNGGTLRLAVTRTEEEDEPSAALTLRAEIMRGGRSVLTREKTLELLNMGPADIEAMLPAGSALPEGSILCYS
jgi:hypothetical protein